MSCSAFPPELHVTPPREDTIQEVPAEVRIRRYEHDKDLEDVMEICKDIYGGTDYMPRMVETYSNQDSTLILVAECSTPSPHQKSAGIIGVCELAP